MRTNRMDGERLTRTLRCVLLAVLSLLLAAGDGWAQSATPVPVPQDAVSADETSAHRRARELPRSATSSDGFVEVLAADVPGDTMGFRLPLLRFTSQFVQDLEHAFGLQMPRAQGRGLVIHALDGQTNDIRVIARVVRRDGNILTRLWLPSPGFTNLEALRFEIAQAYFRAWIDRHRPEDVAEAGQLPKWFSFGALQARTADGGHAAIRAMLELWRANKLPAFPKCVAKLKISSLQDAVLAGYLVAWTKERRAVQALLERLAAGHEWTADSFVELITGERSESEQVKAFQARLDRLSRAVLSPGEASGWDLRNFQSQLTLDLTEFKQDLKPGASSTCTFREAIARVDEPAVRQAAQKKMRELPLYAVRRGPGLAAVSEAYSSFLVMLTRGANADKLVPLLDAAEAKLKEVIEHGGQLAPTKVPEKK